MLRKLGVFVAFLSLGGIIVLATGENDYPSGATVISLNEISEGTVCQPDDPVDWWTVYILGSTEIVVFLDGLQPNDIDLFFFDSTLKLLAQSTGSGPDEVVYGKVRGGRYYIKVHTYYSYPACTDYYIGVLSADVSGYLWRQGDIDIYRLYMRAGKTYWIFLTDHSRPEDSFDPDLYLADSEQKILAESDNQGNIDVIKYTPRYSGYYYVAVGSASGSGYYWLFVGSR